MSVSIVAIYSSRVDDTVWKLAVTRQGLDDMYILGESVREADRQYCAFEGSGRGPSSSATAGTGTEMGAYYGSQGKRCKAKRALSKPYAPSATQYRMRCASWPMGANCKFSWLCGSSGPGSGSFSFFFLSPSLSTVNLRAIQLVSERLGMGRLLLGLSVMGERVDGSWAFSFDWTHQRPSDGLDLTLTASVALSSMFPAGML